MKTMVAFSLALASCLTLAVAGCGDDDDDSTGTAGTAGQSAAGAGGSAAGSGGSAGSAAGSGGSAGSAAGSAGAAGDGTGTGPGATLKCASSGENAYKTYGSAFGVVNDAIIANVFAEIEANGETNIGSSFQNSNQIKNDAAGFKANLAAFLIFAYGGPNNYKGRPMDVAHTGLAITSAQYDYFVTQIVVPALTKNGVPEGDVTSCFAPPLVDAAFKASIVGK